MNLQIVYPFMKLYLDLLSGGLNFSLDLFHRKLKSFINFNIKIFYTEIIIQI